MCLFFLLLLLPFLLPITIFEFQHDFFLSSSIQVVFWEGSFWKEREIWIFSSFMLERQKTGTPKRKGWKSVNRRWKKRDTNLVVSRKKVFLSFSIFHLFVPSPAFSDSPPPHRPQKSYNFRDFHFHWGQNYPKSAQFHVRPFLKKWWCGVDRLCHLT